MLSSTENTSQNRFPTSLSDWFEHIEALHSAHIEMGIDRCSQVLKRLGTERVAKRVILIGGTNGKGTTSAFLANVLRNGQYRVGCYNSPHIKKYNERISVNGIDISDQDLMNAFTEVEKARGEIALTYFEFGTLAAFYYLASQSLDYAILEIGLGGRLDVVNLAQADMCVVTSIGLDHQDWLGDTVEAIAYEKCSIARSDVPLVCGQLNPPNNAEGVCRDRGGVWFERGKDFDLELGSKTPTVILRSTDGAGDETRLTIPRAHIPLSNIATALKVLQLLDELPDEAAVQSIADRVIVAGRMQHINCGTRQLILDVGHNPQAISYLRDQIPEVDCVLLAMLEDKDIKGVHQNLPKSGQLLLAGLNCPRGLSSDALLARIQDQVPYKPGCFDSVGKALDDWFDREDTENSKLLVVGSFFTVEAASVWLEQHGFIHDSRA